LKDTLPFLNCLQSVTRDRFQPGVEPAPIWEVGGRRLAVNICVEDTHPDLCRQAVQQGAEALINLTNDGWFYGTCGPRAHLQAAAWRAIELRRPLLRVTNTGATVAVDPLGNIKMLIPPETEGVAIARLMHLTADDKAPGTLWTWLGEAGVSLIMIVILSVGVLITCRK
jgi:apolipoprotein N-acyltransferase